MKKRVVNIHGGIMRDDCGCYWVWWSVSGEEDQLPGERDFQRHGPHQTIGSAREAANIVTAAYKREYAKEGGIVIKDIHIDVSGTQQ